MSLIPGTRSLGQVGTGSHQVLVSNVGAFYKVGGVTVDFTAVVAETASRNLPGYTTSVGEKIIEAGTVLYKNGSGDYVPAVDTTTLVRGECYVLDRHLLGSETKMWAGHVFARGTVFRARLKIGSAGQPSVANFNAAFPAIDAQNDV